MFHETLKTVVREGVASGSVRPRARFLKLRYWDTERTEKEAFCYRSRETSVVTRSSHDFATNSSLFREIRVFRVQ